MLINKIKQFIYIVSASFVNNSDKECIKDDVFLIYDSYKKPDNVILLECSTFFPYLIPNHIIDIIPFIDVFELDKLVKQYMYFYGSENVRGGSYFEEILPSNKLETIKCEFNTIEKASKPLESNDRTYIYDKIMSYYKNNKIEDKEKELQRIEYECQHYINSKQSYEKLKNYSVYGEHATLGLHTIGNIQWLKDFIIYGDREDVVNKQMKENYKKMVQIIQQITITFLSLRDSDSIKFKPIIYFYNPEMILDPFFYHRKSINNWEKSMCDCLEFIDILEFMTNYIVNRIEEFEYDLSTHPEHPEEYYRMNKLLVSMDMVPQK